MKKILAILPKSIGGRLTTESLISGFKKNGFEVVVFDELKDKILPHLNFEYIIGYDYSPLRIKIDNNLKPPCICYFSDVIQSKTAGVEYKDYYKYLFNKDVFVFYWDRALSLKEGFFYMPHFVDCTIYRDFLPPKVDVLFAGRLDTDLRLKTYLELNKRLKNLKFRFCAIERHYKDAIVRCNSELERDIIKNTYFGFIDNEKDMARVINEAKIVYNINSQGISSLNYRSIQTLACKRLLISDNRLELDLFGGIIPIWDDIDDLVKKITFYLSDSKQYDNIVQKARKLIELNHDSAICTGRILEIISQAGLYNF